MMKKFLFVIPQSPSVSLSPFRKSLIDTSIASLKGQQSSDWEAVFLGEEKKTDNNFNYLNLGGVSKEEKLHHFIDWIRMQENKPQFIIRFDDDDVISPFVLSKANELDFDCYADRHHYFYDTSSGTCSAQIRPWLANTVIHKTEHALAEFGEYHKGVSGSRKPALLQNDHSKTWHEYYKDKKIIFTSKEQPVYLRNLSPTSITGNAGNAYENYRKQFGTWDAAVPAGFESYVTEMRKIWNREFGELKVYHIPFFEKLKNKLRGN
jgi:hypothetical protein